VDVNVSLPEDLAERLCRVTECSGWSQALFIRSAVAHYLDSVEAVVLSGAAVAVGSAAVAGEVLRL
jgi:predicted DNA-binding protein